MNIKKVNQTNTDERFNQKIEVSTQNVSREEVKELKEYLESNCWAWR